MSGGNLYQPQLVRIDEIVDETVDTRTFKLAFKDPMLAASFDFKAGQFGEYSVFGAGECTFCIASAPTRKGFRDAANTSSAETRTSSPSRNTGRSAAWAENGD